jgi:hypothetical protein
MMSLILAVNIIFLRLNLPSVPNFQHVCFRNQIKEKQAQIVGPLTKRRTKKLLKEIDVKVGYRSNIITGCTILDNGKILFSEYNGGQYTNRVSLNDSNGNFIRTDSCSKYNIFTIEFALGA